jgi:hypothetical protein
MMTNNLIPKRHLPCAFLNGKFISSFCIFISLTYQHVSTPTCRIHSQHSKSLYIRNRFTKQLGTIWSAHLTAAHTHNRPSPNAAQNGLGRQVELLHGQSPNKHCNPHVCYVIPCRNFYALFVYQYCKYTSTSVIIIFRLNFTAILLRLEIYCV